MPPQFSFEFFPPKTENGMAQLLQTAATLAKTNPAYFSVTFGAGGSTQTQTPDTVLKIKTRTPVALSPHISCVGAEKNVIKKLLGYYQENGISRLVVLRGDAPLNEKTRNTHFQYASELIQFIRAETGSHFNIAVGCYPEFHPNTTHVRQELFYLKEKIDAGADTMITQYFYNADAFFRFRDDCEKFHIHAPIIPGIMPIVNYEKLLAFSNACGAEIPRWLKFRLETYQHDPAVLQAYCDEVVSRLCEKLLQGGAHELHFYTLNKADSSVRIIEKLRGCLVNL